MTLANILKKPRVPTKPILLSHPGQDASLAIKNFLKLGLRPSLVQIFVSYLQNRKMMVKFKEKVSETHDLPGGGPQGTLIGEIE